MHSFGQRAGSGPFLTSSLMDLHAYGESYGTFAVGVLCHVL